MEHVAVLGGMKNANQKGQRPHSFDDLSATN